MMIVTGYSVSAQIGNVGIGTTTPLAALHVLDSSVLFSASGIVASPIPNIPISGSGRRMLWYPGKSAFRAGYVNGTQWDVANVGLYSSALGQNTTASGNSSTALGFGSTASGDFSTSLGANSVASGSNALAVGQGTVASGNYSTAVGYQATASGPNSIAMGNNVNTNSKTGSFIIGDFTQFATSSNDTINQMLMRFGGGYKLYTDPSTVPAISVLSNGNIGLGTPTPSQKLDVAGVINAQGGNYTGPLTASYSSNTNKTAIYGFANQSASFADYNNTGVTGLGQGNGSANGFGYGFGVKGIGSMNGFGAVGVYAGLGNSIPNTTFGNFYYALLADANLVAANNYAAIFLNGNVGINTYYPAHKLTIAGGSDAQPLTITGGNTSDMNGMVTLAPGRNMTAIDEYILMSGASGTQGSITGNAGAGVAYNTTSDRRLKQNIHNTSFGLNQLMMIEVKDYSYKSDSYQTLQTGFLAQQLFSVYPQAVTVGGEDAAKHPWQIDYSKLTPLLVQAMQELKVQNDLALRENKDLQKNIVAMTKEIEELKLKSSTIATMENRLKQLEKLLNH